MAYVRGDLFRGGQDLDDVMGLCLQMCRLEYRLGAFGFSAMSCPLLGIFDGAEGLGCHDGLAFVDGSSFSGSG